MKPRTTEEIIESMVKVAAAMRDPKTKSEKDLEPEEYDSFCMFGGWSLPKSNTAEESPFFKCECGAHVINSEHHSTWCPLHEGV